MLIAVIIVLAVVAVGLLVLYLGARSSAAEFRAQAERREEELIAERDQLTSANAELESELAAARAEHEQKEAELTGKLTASEDEVRNLTAKNEEAAALAAEQRAKLDEQSEQLIDLTAEITSHKTRVEEVEAALAAANARNAGILVGDVVDLGATQPQTLWDLEVKRSERTWRTSVAPNPDAPTSPFDEADDPVKVAVEIEAAALRENVGAFITIDWQAEPIDDPARRHLVVRVAQEMLEAAARSPEASRLVVTQLLPAADEATTVGDSDTPTDGEAGGATEHEIKLRLEPVDDDEVINIIPPRITSDLIDVRDETTIVVTTAPAPAAQTSE